jgi:hypothetical protein
MARQIIGPCQIRGTTSVDKPLPTFQLYGSIITASFHVAELGVMSQFIVFMFFYQYMGK